MDSNSIRKIVLEYFENEPTDVLATAYMYARNMKNYGIDITKDLDTATSQQAALHQAYMKGVADEYTKVIGFLKYHIYAIVGNNGSYYSIEKIEDMLKGSKQ